IQTYTFSLHDALPIFVLISICICIIFTSEILCNTNHLLYILIQSFLYIVRVSFIIMKAKLSHIKISKNSLKVPGSPGKAINPSVKFAILTFLLCIESMIIISDKFLWDISIC